MLFGSFIRACDLEKLIQRKIFSFKIMNSSMKCLLVIDLANSCSINFKLYENSSDINTHRNFLALTIIVDVNMRILWISTASISCIAEATLLMNLTVTSPCFIAICTNFTTWIKFFWALRYTDTFS